MVFSASDLRSLPVYAPLLAAVIAPFCTLFDIPALSEKWFTEDGTPLPDPEPNLILSSVGLGFSFLANALLIIRFSMSGRGWRTTTMLSTACWTVKFIVALANIVTFGFLKGNRKGISYGEAFWCALVSLVMTAIIMALLLCHYVSRFKDSRNTLPSERQIEVRIAGRHFMIQTTLFVCTTGTLALYMSRLEHWSYMQGIYFSIVSFLTLGFGDFTPTKTATQVVLFPFLIVGIVQLACLIGMLAHNFSQRIAKQHSNRRRRAAKLRQDEEKKLSNEPDLEKELQYLAQLYRSTNEHETLKNLAVASVGFLTFWLIGALIFSRVEGWTYGQGLYFCYVFFLAVGYGDFAPITPAGRVILTVYAIIAVPIMTTFVVETIQGITRDFSNRLLERRKAKFGLSIRLDPSDGPGDLGESAEGEKGRQTSFSGGDVTVHNVEGDENLPRLLDWDRPHTEFVDRAHRQIDSLLQNAENKQRDEKKDDDSQGASSDLKDADLKDADRILTEHVLELAVELEQHARRLLLAFTEEGSDVHILLKADRLVQLQNIRALALWEEKVDQEAESSSVTHSEKNRSTSAPGMAAAKTERQDKLNMLMRKYYEEETELSFPSDLDQKETIEEVVCYREAFAGLLAAGSRLMRLEEDKQMLFERRARSRTGLQDNP